MRTTHFPDTFHKFELQVFDKPSSLTELRKTHVPFSGSPQKHPYDPAKIILLTDPYSGINSYFEFKKEDVGFVEELPSIVNLQEETITMIRLWIKKQSVGICGRPFMVEDTA